MARPGMRLLALVVAGMCGSTMGVIDPRWQVMDWAFTPRFPNGTLNLGVVPAMMDATIGVGTGVVLVGGTGGEWPSTTVANRIALMQAWVAAAKAAKSRYPPNTVPRILFHVGSTCIEEGRIMAAAAEAAGVDAMLIVSPGIIYKPGSIQQAVAGLAAIASAAPTTPVWYYHFPSMYGVDLNMVQLVTTAYNLSGSGTPATPTWSNSPLPTLRGVKYIDNDLNDMASAIDVGTSVGIHLEFFVDTDYATSCLPFGCVGTPCNTPSAPFCNAIGQAYLSGNMTGATYWQRQYWAFSSLMGGADREVYGVEFGIDVGDVVLPQQEISPAAAAQAIAALQAAGYLPK